MTETAGSAALNRLIAGTSPGIADAGMRELFENCLRNCIETSVEQYEEGGRELTFVITGDIPAMWLRDSTAQVWPYLRLADDPEVARILRGVVNQQADLILRDPYANAFLRDTTAPAPYSDLTETRAGVHERKWEPDSLGYAMRLGHGYWRATGDLACFDGRWRSAMELALATLREQQRLAAPSPYRFQRETTNPLDTLADGGRGWPVQPNGMVASAFRASDDACVFPFNIPTQHFLTVCLSGLAELATAVGADALAASAAELRGQIGRALELVAAGYPEWPFEVDGFGNALFADDPNIPNLLSLPYLGACRRDDPRYLATRERGLSPRNPFYYSGALLSGLGSPHTGSSQVWPMALIMQAMTATDDAEIELCLRQILASSGGRGLLNESVDIDNTDRYTRGWFGWCNSLFAELILQLAAERPHLLDREYGATAGR